MQTMGTLYVVAAPSGCGKTSLVNALLESMDRILVSISHTTRPMRPLEKNAVNYYFVSHAEFDDMVKEGVFFEHALVYGHQYGTSRLWVEQQLRQNQDVILEIDWQGAQQIRLIFPHCVTIFILPPSQESLRARLEARQQDPAEVIEQRMAVAISEMKHYREFDYLVINDVFTEALADLKAIIQANRLREVRQATMHEDLLAKLVENR